MHASQFDRPRLAGEDRRAFVASAMTFALRHRAFDAAIPAAAAFLYSVAILMPWVPDEREAAADFSWTLVLHQAFLRGFHFGSDIVFTYGPWGFLQGGYHAATYGMVLLCWLMFSAAFVTSLWALLRRNAAPGVAALYTCLAAALIVASGREALLMLLPLLLFVLARDAGQRRYLLLLPLLVAVALAALIKFSLLVLAFALVGLLSLEEVWGRRLPLAIAALSLATLGWWVAASQALRDLVPFLGLGFELTGNYGEAMARSEGAAYDVAVVAAMGAGCAVAAGFVLARRNRSAAIGSAGALLFLLFVLKSGFTRFWPQNAQVASAALLVAGILLLFGTWPSMKRRGPQLALALVIASSAVLIAAARPRSPHDFSPFHVVPVSWSGHRGALDAQYEVRIAPYRDAIRGLKISGGADAYPFRLAAIAERRDYAPRPVIQSYAAYTTHLAKLNAKHLEKEGAPRWVLFDVEPIDHRLPSIEDSLSWPILLDRYRVAGSGENVLLLERHAAPPRKMRPLTEFVTRFGAPFTVPSVPLWVTIDIKPTIVGRIAQMVYRVPAVSLRVTTADGVTRDYRLLRDVARGGFLLSPLIESREQFAAFSRGDPLPARRVVSLEILESTPWLHCDRDELHVKLAELGR